MVNLRYSLFYWLSLGCLLLSSCAPQVIGAMPSGSTPLAQVSLDVPDNQAQFPTATPIPTLPSSPTATSNPSVTLTPTPTLHPMHILALRQTPYPGSEIVIENELERGANYRRYYASYLSDGLKIYGLLTIPNGEQTIDLQTVG